MKIVKKYLPYAVVALWAIACFLFFQLKYPYHFFIKEQDQLFLLSAEYVGSYLQKPAWLARLAGDFLTQFYYYLYVGATVLTLCLLLLGDLVRRGLERAGVHRLPAFAVALLVMTWQAVCHLHVLYELSSTMALVGGAATYLAFSYQPGRSGRKGWLRTLCALPLTVLAWWLFGYGCWLFLLLAVVETLLCRKPLQAVALLAAIPLTALTAHLTANYFLLQTGPAMVYPGIGKLHRPEWQVEKVLAYGNEYRFGHYDRVIQMWDQETENSTETNFYACLAYAQQANLPHIFQLGRSVDLGTYHQIAEHTPIFILRMMNEYYWAVGDMTFTERAAMSAHVFSPRNRNVRFVKRLAECNMVNGDTAAANKYLRLLEKTLVYSDWAKRNMRQPDPEYILKKQYINRQDTIRHSKDNLDMLVQLLESNPDNLMARDHLLCSDLMNKDIHAFKEHYDRFVLPNKKLPSHEVYQQALCVYMAVTEAPKEEWESYAIDKSVLKAFEDYNKNFNNPVGARRYTYWFYYQNAKLKKES